MDLSDLGASAQEILEAFATQLVDQDPAFELPGHRYVGAGEIPWDNEGLYVYLDNITTGQPGAPQGTSIISTAALVTTISVFVMLVRKVATFSYFSFDGPNPATDDQLMNNGVTSFRDLGALWRAALALKQSGALVVRGAGFVISEGTPLGPMGEMAAVRLKLELSVDA